jgi:phosphomannomutase
MAELTADLRRGGLTIPDQIDLLESRHGVHEERVLGLRMERLEAVEALFARWRTQRPARLGGLAVAEIEDRLANPWRNPVTGALLPDDFLLLHLRGDDARAVSARLALRRSGTEPKLKVYVHARRAVGVHESLREVRAGLRALADSLAAELLRGL